MSIAIRIMILIAVGCLLAFLINYSCQSERGRKQEARRGDSLQRTLTARNERIRTLTDTVGTYRQREAKVRQASADAEQDKDLAFLRALNNISTLSAQQQKALTMQSIAANRPAGLPPIDTSGPNVVGYKRGEQLAVSTREAQCVELERERNAYKLDLTLTQDDFERERTAHKLDKDTSDTRGRYIAEGHKKATQKGWFTGKKKKSWQHLLNPPY